MKYWYSGWISFSRLTLMQFAVQDELLPKSEVSQYACENASAERHFLRLLRCKTTTYKSNTQSFDHNRSAYIIEF